MSIKLLHSLQKQAQYLAKSNTNVQALQFLQGSTSLSSKFHFQFSQGKPIQYVRGFRNTHYQELREGLLPKHTNPKYPPNNLVVEQFTGPQGFTGEASSGGPLRLWLYKRERTLKAGVYKECKNQQFSQAEFVNPGPNPLRFPPPAKPTKPTDFVEGMIPIADNAHVLHYQYSFNTSMNIYNKAYHNLDGEMLFQPSVGKMQILTECGILELEPGIIGVIPKNMKFQVNTESEYCQGVITELKNDRSLRVPHRGPIGANGLANPEYFQSPVPYVDTHNLDKEHTLVCKKQDTLYQATQNNSPFDVYAWKGNYAPYRFNLEDFVPIIAGNRDHLDPSSHIVLAVGAADGANDVELVVFAPRFNVSSDKYPTYLPPYDHRNCGKAEIMHYLGGYDAREGTAAGYQTIHDMGVNHGNDQKTFEKARSSENKNIYLDFPPATMLELTNFLRVTPQVLKNQDKDYHAQLQGLDSEATPKIKPAQSILGPMRKIHMTTFETSLVPIFDILMPNPEINHNSKTGLTVRTYTNSRGDQFVLESQEDQNKYWELYKQTKDGAKIDVSGLAKRDVSKASDEELLQVVQTIKTFFNRGSVVSQVDMEVDNPEATYNYFLGKGFAKGRSELSVALNENAPLNFRFITRGSAANPNPEAYVSTIDHTVINVFRKQLDQLYALFPEEFWGGDPRDLRAEGVQFDTRVLTSHFGAIEQLVPVNNLDATEEAILHRVQDKDTYLPPYIKDAAIGNQITRGLMDTNRTEPTASKDAFLQHIAMHVNTKYGDISEHLQRLKDKGMRLIPGPPKEYFELSEVDLSQRVLLPIFFKLVGVDAFAIPSTFFNGLLKPKDASVQRLNEILVEDNNWSQAQADPIIAAYNKIQPLLQVVGDNVLKFEEKSMRSLLEAAFKKQGITVTAEDYNTTIDLIKFNKKKVERAQAVGSLLDFQIINIGGQNQTGYLDQTFSVPVTQQNEGTSGIFLEFIVRTCWDEIFELMKSGKFYTDVTEFKSCGAFGQGNFGNLMLGQQLGIAEVDRLLKKKQQLQGYAFQLPMLDYPTINSTPLNHLNEGIDQVKSRKEDHKVKDMETIVKNLQDIVGECQKRGLW